MFKLKLPNWAVSSVGQEIRCATRNPMRDKKSDARQIFIVYVVLTNLRSCYVGIENISSRNKSCRKMFERGNILAIFFDQEFLANMVVNLDRIRQYCSNHE